MKKLALLFVPALLAACASASTYSTVTVHDLKKALEGGAYLLDVRTPEEYAAGHIAGAHNLPLDKVAGWTGELPQDKTIYVICRSGHRSAQASELLKKAGLDVMNVGGGMNDWLDAGYPTTH